MKIKPLSDKEKKLTRHMGKTGGKFSFYHLMSLSNKLNSWNRKKSLGQNFKQTMW